MCRRRKDHGALNSAENEKESATRQIGTTTEKKTRRADSQGRRLTQHIDQEIQTDFVLKPSHAETSKAFELREIAHCSIVEERQVLQLWERRKGQYGGTQR